MRKATPYFVIGVMLLCALPTLAAELDLLAERTDFVETGELDEVYASCEALARQHPDQVRCFQFGQSAEGRPLVAIAANRKGVLNPSLAVKKSLPVTLFIAGIHAGEVVGKDATLIALRDLLNDTTPNALDDVVMLIVPMFNADGYARFDTNNRPNQRGPKRTGWRVTAQNMNLNRDWAKAETLEMRAMLALIEQWHPLVGVDLHSTDGAQFQHDIAIMVEPVWIANTPLKDAALTLESETLAYLTQQGSLPIDFYPSFNEHDNPASGVVHEVMSPRYSQGYFWMRNMLGMLVETHSWRSYKERVIATRHTIDSVLGSTAKHAQSWSQARAQAASMNSRLVGQSVILAAKASDKTRMIDFLGYRYSRTPSPISGAMMTRYDEQEKAVWKMPLADDFQASQTVVAPSAYLVPQAYWGHVKPLIDAHGFEYRVLGDQEPSMSVAQYSDITPAFSSTSFEGRQLLTLDGQWQGAAYRPRAGDVLLPVNQPKALLLMALLEPEGVDSLARWGFFNAAFERKEYMEAYVIESEAEKMLAADPALKKQFEEALRDPEFAGNPGARLAFFYQRHPAWDGAYGVYPVRRVLDITPAR